MGSDAAFAPTDENVRGLKVLIVDGPLSNVPLNSEAPTIRQRILAAVARGSWGIAICRSVFEISNGPANLSGFRQRSIRT